MTATERAYDIDDIRMTNKSAGKHFFEAGALRFFASRILPTVYQGPGGIYFVTSEQFRPSSGPPHPRKYTVRRFNPETGDVGTVGEFQGFTRSRAAAKTAIARAESQAEEK